jgi:hypothetical protein
VYTVTISDTNGLFGIGAMTDLAGRPYPSSITGPDTDSITLTGSLSGINAYLPDIIDTDPVAAPDEITVTASDNSGDIAPAQTIPVTVSAPNFSLAFGDPTIDNSLPVLGDHYSGPVAGLTQQLTEEVSSGDNVSIDALIDNVYAVTVGNAASVMGESAIQVLGGTNVLSGADCSTFFIGGTSTPTVSSFFTTTVSRFDTFDCDPRNATGPTWDTITNFHSGDYATIWGITQGGFDLAWVNGQGAVGYTGLTLDPTDTGKPTVSLTLAGLTTAALTDGNLNISYGTTGGVDYMLIHAN